MFKSPGRQQREELLEKVLGPLTDAERDAIRLAFISGISRQDLLTLAEDVGLVRASQTLTGGIELTAGGEVIEVGGVKAWRGIGQAMSLAVQGFSGGANTCVTHRTRHYSNARFRKVRAVLQTFYPAGTPIVDTNFADNYNFQVGFEVGYVDALTGIAPRKMFTFSGAETAAYLAASPPDTGYILSDVLDLGEFVEAGDFFGLWTTVEAPSGGSNKIPYQRNSSSYIDRFGGVINAALSTDSARSASAVSAFSESQSGGSTYYAPCMLLIETDSSLPFVAAIGDSITYGVGEGVSGSGSAGDSLGSPLGNSGLVERGVVEGLGYNIVNFGKGSDGCKYLRTASNWAKRSQLLALANPTHVIQANVHNDISDASIVVSGWAATTVYAKWTVVSANSGHYVCIRSGTSGATAPSGTGQAIVDATCTWAYVQPAPAVSSVRASSIVLAQIANVNSQISATVPGAPIISMLPTPDASSSDSFSTTANQTPATYFGDASSRRGVVRALMSAPPAWSGIKSVFDPSEYLESGYPVESSKWVTNGAAHSVTYDGTHPNSSGANAGAAAITASLFAEI